MKRTLSLLLALTLAAALLVCPAAAASSGSPWLQMDGQSVSLQGLTGRYTAVQITLNLNQEAAGSFTFAPTLSTGDTHTTYTVSGNSLTLYIASKSTLGLTNALSLGSLAAQGITVESVPSLKLVNVGPNDTEEVTASGLAIKNAPTQGGYDPGPGWDNSWDNNWGGGVTRYPVQAAPGTAGGSVQFSTTHAAPGETVIVTTSPNSGYILNSLAVTDSQGRGVPVSGLGGGKWSFVMPSSAVTIAVTFTPTQPATLPFRDVAQGDWFRDAVAYVYNNKLMNGTSPDLFSPWATTTRGMIVTILYRYEGSPAAGGASFPDVPQGEYYAAPVAWAAANGVVNGYETGLFEPQNPITREQMAAILYRYAQRKGLDVSGIENIFKFQQALERLAFPQVIQNMTREALAELFGRLADCERLIDQDMQLVAHLNESVHRKLFEISRFEGIMEAVDLAYGFVQAFNLLAARDRGRQIAITEEHRAILSAIQQRDQVLLNSVADYHLEACRLFAVQFYQKLPRL